MTGGLEPTMAIIGCGSLGSVILQRVLELSDEQLGARDVGDSRGMLLLPTRFLACVRTPESASRLKDRFAVYVVVDDSTATKQQQKRSVEVICGAGRNVEAVRQSTVVLLGCQPSQVADVVAEEGMVDALRGKLVLNICAGITDAVLWGLICRRSSSSSSSSSPSPSSNGAAAAVAADRRIRREDYYFVHAMPNAASLVGQSESIVNPRPANFPERYNVLTDWILGAIGHVTELPRELMAVGTVTAGCAVGFLAPVLQGIAAGAGAGAAGLDRDVALRMAAQAVKGAAELVLAQGKTPDDLVREVATPGGCTARGLQVLADKGRTGNVAMAFEAAVKEAVARIFELEASSNGVDSTA
ncbi:pyrroline-5-carboxylate reductase [Apiospora phragmitis]|uniref:Pyrroline-5-carboxylate reductase n=1 Tax=Apiospora phragmitis TaxID=2905665 RepID=A0ABR1VJN1_9PEZI